MKRTILTTCAVVALCSAPLQADLQQTPPTQPAALGGTISDNLVCSGPINHDIEQSFNGTYIKWETVEISDGTDIPEANFNPYAQNSELTFYWPNSSTGNAGVAATTTGREWQVLQIGDEVGPSSVFSAATGAADNWFPGANGYLGFKFSCSTASTCYGYARMTSSGPNGFPAKLVNFCFDIAGDAVTIGPELIFRSGFEDGDGILTVTLNRDIQPSFSGTHIKWETAEISDGTEIQDANFNPYTTGSKLTFYWPNASTGNAGVSATANGKDWRVLQTGDQIGPGSVFSKGAGEAANWTPGVNGYLGFKFDCSTAGTCYGYVHILTKGPNGFPAKMLKYRYDSTGKAITIQ